MFCVSRESPNEWLIVTMQINMPQTARLVWQCLVAAVRVPGAAWALRPLAMWLCECPALRERLPYMKIYFLRSSMANPTWIYYTCIFNYIIRLYAWSWKSVCCVMLQYLHLCILRDITAAVYVYRAIQLRSTNPLTLSSPICPNFM